MSGKLSERDENKQDFILICEIRGP